MEFADLMNLGVPFQGALLLEIRRLQQCYILADHLFPVRSCPGDPESSIQRRRFPVEKPVLGFPIFGFEVVDLTKEVVKLSAPLNRAFLFVG